LSWWFKVEFGYYFLIAYCTELALVLLINYTDYSSAEVQYIRGFGRDISV